MILGDIMSFMVKQDYTVNGEKPTMSLSALQLPRMRELVAVVLT